MTEQALDPATQKIIDDFDAHAKKRAAELVGHTDVAPLQATREISFCLGYKAGVIDLGAALREQPVVDISQLAAVFAAACEWRDAIPTSIARNLSIEERLIAAVDAARAARRSISR
jgi:hypothetical protein